MNVRLDILAWLLVPLGVTLVALFVVGWRARPKRPSDAHEGMAEMEKFREAMAKPLPTLGPAAVGRQGEDQDADTSQRGAA
ncbi:MAG: hypothetical protein ABI468_01560 [Candidatus Nanopelagicales bacterium]